VLTCLIFHGLHCEQCFIYMLPMKMLRRQSMPLHR